MQAYNAERDFTYVVRLTCAVLLLTLAIGWKLFVPELRLFALSPALTALNSLPPIINRGILALCVSCLLWLFIHPERRAPAWGIILCFVFWVLQDITRFTPFFYMYWYVILVTALSQNHRAVGLDAVRIMICGVYFWAGFHKMNATFYMSVFPWFVEPLHTFGGGGLVDTIFQVGLFITPYFEAVIGIFLLRAAWRHTATAMAFTMLAVVLVCLGPFGHNWAMIVWPWNIYLFMLEFRLFLNPDYNAESPFLLSNPSRLGLVSAALFILLPVAAMWSNWYTLPGFKLYSGNFAYGRVMVAPKEKLSKAPNYIKKMAISEGHVDLIHWTENELHSIVYPVPYAFKTGAAGLCPYLDYPEKATLRIFYAAPFYTTAQEHEDVPLCR